MMLQGDCTIALSWIQANRQRMFWLTWTDRRHSVPPSRLPFSNYLERMDAHLSSFLLAETFATMLLAAEAASYIHPSISIYESRSILSSFR